MKHTSHNPFYCFVAPNPLTAYVLFAVSSPSDRPLISIPLAPPLHDCVIRRHYLVGNFLDPNKSNTNKEDEGRTMAERSLTDGNNGMGRRTDFSRIEALPSSSLQYPEKHLATGNILLIGVGIWFDFYLKDCPFRIENVTLRSDGHLMTEFKIEILALSKIENLNLVRLYGSIEYKDRMIVMEYVGMECSESI